VNEPEIVLPATLIGPAMIARRDGAEAADVKTLTSKTRTAELIFTVAISNVMVP
jgi:hypothetical protein